VAEVVVAAAAPVAGEHVVDVGCGTGNGALLAAARGARATGVDPAPRLLEVARALARAEGLDATFAEGEAAAIPLDDGEADALLSIFGVIFAPDAAAAAAEMTRVTAPGGRIVLSAWTPGGAMSQAVRLGREAMGGPPGPPPFDWHDRDALRGLFGDVEIAEHELAFTGESPRAFLDAELASHPLWKGLGDRTPVDRVLEVLESRNEDPGAFRVTSRYVVATARC
jgi:SAM-dependent methyltransferase